MTTRRELIAAAALAPLAPVSFAGANRRMWRR